MIDKLDNLYENNPNAYWSLLREISGSKVAPSGDSISGKEWFNYFKDLSYKPYEDTENLKNIKESLTKLEKEKIFTELDIKITENEIRKAISSLKNKKSSGFDSILNEMLKYGQNFLIKSFYKIFNNILTSGKIPQIWARGIIVPIFKSGDKDDPSNYRGITVSSCLGKLFSKILNSRLEKFFESRNIICKEQIGFCAGSRTTDHMFILKTLIDKYKSSPSKKLYCCFIDFRRAFDSVILESLFYKLRLYGISDIFYNIIKDMYSKTELNVKINNDLLTESFISNIDVRQGDNLRPNLFKLFINDLPTIFDNCCSPAILNSCNINCLLYADDFVLISESPEGLQNCLDRLALYCKKMGAADKYE